MSSLNNELGAYVVIMAPTMLLSCGCAWKDCGPLYTKALSVLLGMNVALMFQVVPSAETTGAEFKVKTVGLDLEVALFVEAYLAALALFSHVEGWPVYKAQHAQVAYIFPCDKTVFWHDASGQNLEVLAEGWMDERKAKHLPTEAVVSQLSIQLLCRRTS